MSVYIPLLHSKLMVPSLSNTVFRERLHPLPDEIKKRKLTLVTAGAGYGKSTLIAQYTQALNRPTIWYRLNHSDKDIITFLSYMTAGIQNYFPEFGEKTLQIMKQALHPKSNQEALLTIFLNELENCVKDSNKDGSIQKLVFVFDDYHLVQHHNGIANAILFLLEYLQPWANVILISRFDINLPLSRLRAMQSVADITEKDLAFTENELRQLILALFHISIDKKNIKTLHKKTGGWISGLILFLLDLRELEFSNIEKNIQYFDGSKKFIRQYFEENIFKNLPAVTREFLIKTSIVSNLNPACCAQLLKKKNTEETLDELANKHLFTFHLKESGSTYHYHSLFREFLQEKLASCLDTASIYHLHYRAALHFESKGEFGEALAHYLESRQMEEAGRMLGGLGRQLFWEGRLDLIKFYLSKIPKHYLNKEPWIQYLQALSLWYEKKPMEALNFFRMALSNFQKQHITEGEVQCMMDMSINYFDTGDYFKARESLEIILGQKALMPYLRYEILGHLTFMSSYAGDLSIADEYYEEAMLLLPAIDNETFREGARVWLFLVQSYRYFFAGDFIQAITIANQAKEIVDNAYFPRLTAYFHQVIALSAYHIGEYKKGEDHARRGLAIVKEKHLTDASLIRLLVALSLNLIGRGDSTGAVEYAKEAISLAQKVGNRIEQAYAYMTLFLSAIVSGNLSQADDHLKHLEKVVSGMNLPLLVSEIKGIKASLLIEKGCFDKAWPLMEDAKKSLGPFTWHMAWISRVYARFFWKQNRTDEAINALVPALILSEQNCYDSWAIFDKHWIMPLLIEVYANGKMKNYIQQIFNKLWPQAERELQYFQKNVRTTHSKKIFKSIECILKELPQMPPPGIHVRLLGKFELSIGNKDISAKKWKSQKAKMLFKYLIHSRPKGYVNKEILMELLWPEEDAAKTGKRLHVALASMRKTLEPDIQKGIPSSYILSNNNSYRLDIGCEGGVDIENLKEALSLASKENDPEKSIPYYLKAESIYQGEFLEEDPFVDWCAEEREQFREQYLNLLNIIINYYEIRKDYSHAIEYAKKYLSVDKYAENIYQKVMLHYSLIGKKHMVVRTFERCKENICNDLGCPLSQETEASYNELIKNNYPSLKLIAN